MSCTTVDSGVSADGFRDPQQQLKPLWDSALRRTTLFPLPTAANFAKGDSADFEELDDTGVPIALSSLRDRKTITYGHCSGTRRRSVGIAG